MEKYTEFQLKREESEQAIIKHLSEKFPNGSKVSWLTSRSKNDGTGIVKTYRQYGTVGHFVMDSGWARVSVKNSKTGKSSWLCFGDDFKSEE
jgi:hypothetical protein